MTPRSLYLEQLQQGHVVEDQHQLEIVQRLDRLHQLLEQDSEPAGTVAQLLRQWSGRKKTPLQGCYIYGGVGRGKTWLMDLFYHSLSLEKKIRLHFYHFMQAIHDELTLLKGYPSPLRLVAKNFARQARVVCVDEFHVADITDAMLLYGLLEAMFQEGITLVMTSNLPPDDLYKNGLQRERFLPAIALIKQHTQVLAIGGDEDHRLRLLEATSTWINPDDADSQQRMLHQFSQLAPCEVEYDTGLDINYRQVAMRARADDLAWFDFSQICNSPRATPDYITLAKRFHTVFISRIPILDDSISDQARRFISLIDEFYDRHVKIVCSSSSDIASLYQGKELAFEFERTRSRIQEMSSPAYMAQAHRPD